MRVVIVIACALLGGCALLSPRTEVSVTYDDGAGKVLTAHYESTKDVSEPAFHLVRDADGRVQEIHLSASGSLGAPVQEQNAILAGQIAGGVVGGLVRSGVLVAP